ncbi:acyltransferase family protein [Neptunomonas marina]|uniref:Acyltransferase n=1 Tax=Neptunomonas marina TaxID=1815562 RepID=A0A437QCI0_9GAMM|nr:acyltransferase [Neptunomonas marina]RVU32252.1 acyltransferase [Neptunomonas marina]
MNRQFSVYLDLVRFSAAIAVFISHVPAFAGGWLWQLSGFGHEAVVIFFVLSGFVISYVVFDRKENAQKYTISRLSRIYSVAIPAIIITAVLYYVGQSLNPEAFYSLGEEKPNPLLTLFSALTFTNQSWIATPILSNLPYWSLGYEVLYYIFFGVLVYTKGKSRIALLALITLVMGLSILLYLPIWLAGVFCFKKLNAYSLTLHQSLSIFILSVVGIALFSTDNAQDLINGFSQSIIGPGFYQLLLEPAEKFASDYILAFFVTAHIFSGYHLTKKSNFFAISQKAEQLIKEASSHTFSLYLYHMPMLYFISAVFPYSSNPVMSIVFCWIIVPTLIFMISNITEKRKGLYTVFFNNLLAKHFKLS